MTAIIVLLANITVLRPVGFIALAGAAALTLWSMVLYLRAAWPYLLPDSSEK
jgi:CDP-diacylglycerol---glycerol-3-phosphate 3-phosphatidyltransferase